MKLSVIFCSGFVNSSKDHGVVDLNKQYGSRS